MFTPMELHEELGIALTRPTTNGSVDYKDALASAVAVLADDKIEAHAAWFDWGATSEDQAEEQVAVHIRLIVPSGVIALDHEFSFDGLPDARFITWSRVTGLRVIAKFNSNQPKIANAWLETGVGRIEFAGASSPDEFHAIVASLRAHLK